MNKVEVTSLKLRADDASFSDGTNNGDTVFLLWRFGKAYCSKLVFFVRHFLNYMTLTFLLVVILLVTCIEVCHVVITKTSLVTSSPREVIYKLLFCASSILVKARHMCYDFDKNEPPLLAEDIHRLTLLLLGEVIN